MIKVSQYRYYRAVVKGPDGSVAESTGPILDVIAWAEKYVIFLTDGFELSVDPIEIGGDDGCIGIT